MTPHLGGGGLPPSLMDTGNDSGEALPGAFLVSLSDGPAELHPRLAVPEPPPTKVSPREQAKRLLRANRGRPAMMLVRGQEYLCTAIELEGVVYALLGPSLHEGAVVRWLP